jgi:hypothetical protein
MLKNSLITILTALFFTNPCLGSAVVKNADEPVKGEWEFALKKAWEIDALGGDILTQVNAIRIDEKGNIYLVENKLLKIYILDPAGKPLYSFGKRGEGPGEIKFPLGFFLKGDHIIVVDLGRFHYFSRTGQFIKSENPGMMTMPRAFLDDHRFIMVPQQPEGRKQANDRLQLFDLKSQKRTTITEITAEKQATYSSERLVLKVIDPLTHPTVVVESHGESLFFGKSDRYLVKKIDLQGNELLAFSLAGRKQKKISEDFLRKRFEGITFNNGKMPKEMVDQMIKASPDQATYFYRIWIDESGLIYVFVSDPVNRQGREIDIFSPAGKYLYHGQIKLTDNYIPRSNLTIRGNTLCVFAEDQEGETKLIKYHIQTPKI